MTFEEACKARDSVLDSLLALKQYEVGTMDRLLLTRYLAFKENETDIPMKLRKEQALVWERLT